MSLTVLLPVFNEELHVARCLESVVGWADRIVVVDSFSTDRTCEIVRSFADRGVELVQHAYEGPADQKNWALDQLGLDTEWVLFLDADEWVTPELAREIQERCRTESEVAGFLVNRRIVFFGRWIRHGGWFPNWNLRLLRRGRGRYEQRRVHEHVQVDGPVERLAGHLVHEDLRDLTHMIAKHNRYSNLEAAEYGEVRAGRSDGYARLFTRDPLARRRWIKTKVWLRLPCKPLLYLLWTCVFRLGFLDGAIGLRFHALQAMFKAFDQHKLWELERTRAVPGPTGASPERKAA